MSPPSPPAAPPSARDGWLPYLWYESAFVLSTGGFTLGFSLRTEGRKNVPQKGPALLIANHQSFLDPPLVGLAARRHLCYLARKSLFDHPAMTWLIRSLNAVPIDQEGLGIDGLRVILRQLREGQAVLVFPEGNRTPDGALQALKPGIQLLIKRARAPIVPVGIAGAFDAWPRGRSLPILAPLFLPAGKATLAVVIGRPLDPERFVDLPRDEVLAQLSWELQQVFERAERLRRKP